MRILIVNYQWIARLGLTEFLTSLDPATETVHAGGVEDAVKALSTAKRFDLCLLDFQMPGQDPLAVLRAVRAAAPKIPILIVTAAGSRRLALEAVEQGASGFVLTSATPEELTRALQRVCEGDIWLPAGLRDMPSETPLGLAEDGGRFALPQANPAVSVLTPRQRQVLELIATGKRNVDIAEALRISPRKPARSP